MPSWLSPPLPLIGAVTLLFAAGAGVSCGGATSSAALETGGKLRVASNVRRQDYAGSAACAKCHAAIYDAFMHAPMHRMTRKASDENVAAPFEGARLEIGGDSATVEQHAARKYMRLRSSDGIESIYRITKVIGGRTREDYVGIRVRDTHGGDDVIAEEQGERVMPLSYLLFSKTWRYKGYSVMVRERDKLRVGTSWSRACIFCHNTEPLLDALYDDVRPTKELYQGSVGDNRLPPERTWHYTITDPSALVDAVDGEVEALGAPRPEGDVDQVLAAAIRATRSRFGEENLVELGVGCESCHLGSRAHAEDPQVRPSLTPSGAGLELGPPDNAPPTHAAVVNRTCARCHTVLFSQYPFTWEGGKRADAAPGGSHINSGEARDFLLGGCAGQMSCVTCHDPHKGSSKARLDELGTNAGNTVCTTCHEKLSSAEALRAHSRHAPGSEGSACVGCHMPKKNVGLSYELTRYHRIGSPTDDARVYGDRPLECNLCHVDWSVERTVGEMEKTSGKRFDRDRLRELYGDLSGNGLEITMEVGKPHEQVAAAAAFAERGDRSALAKVLPVLGSPYPLVRLFVAHALERRIGERLDVDLDGEPAETQKIVRARLEH